MSSGRERAPDAGEGGVVLQRREVVVAAIHGSSEGYWFVTTGCRMSRHVYSSPSEGVGRSQVVGIWAGDYRRAVDYDVEGPTPR